VRAAQLAAKGLSPVLAGLRPEGGWRIEVAREMQAVGIEDAGSFEAADWYAARAREEIARDPLGVVRRAPLKLAAWWAPDFFLPRHLLRDWYGPAPPALAAALALLCVIASAVPLLGGPAALAALRGSRFRSLGLAWLGLAAVVHALLFGVSRMHQPFVPLLVIAVCAFAFDAHDAPARRRLLTRGAPVAAVALAAWLVSAPAVFGLWVAPGPRHVAVARAFAFLGETPLPASRWAAWARADAVAASGDEREAAAGLAASRHAEHRWTLVQRALLAEPEGVAPLVRRALAAGPIAGYEGVLRALAARGQP
jgi:hypothetical protein